MTKKEYFRDILSSDLDIVFCGMDPGNKSAKIGAYYAHKGNRFWSLLFEIGLTPRILEPEEFPVLVNFRAGLTDLFKDQKGMDDKIDISQFKKKEFEKKILDASPKRLAFTSKNVGSVYFGLKTTKLNYGLQEAKIGKTEIYILPGTSPANNANWIRKNDEYFNFWKQVVN